MKLSKDLIHLMLRYGLVGGLATVVHTILSLVAHELLGVIYFWAHAAGFCGGLITAYLGHYHYSFRDSGNHTNRFPKFVISSLIGFALHQSGVYYLVSKLGLDYSTQALPILMIGIPLLTFLMSKFWVFR